MGLVPVDGILATVMKVADQSPEAAAELVRIGLFESLCDQIDEQRPALEVHALAFIEKRAAKARATMLRTHVGKALSGEEEPDDLAYAQGLAVLDQYVEVGKDNLFGRALSMFNQQHPRDSKGRFVRSDVGGSVDPNLEAPTRRSAHQKEALNTVATWREAGLAGDNTPVTLHYTRVDPMTGRVIGTQEKRLPSNVANLAEDMDAYDRSEGGQHLLTGISIQRGQIPSGNAKQRAAMDALATLTSGNAEALQAGGRFARNIPNQGDWDQAGDQWNRSSSPGDRQGYRRMKMTGQALTAVSAPGSPVNIVGGLAQLVGDMGPEAEKVLGPGFTRAAYRYRGTERRPDRQLSTSVEYANQAAAGMFHPRQDMRERNIATIGRKSVDNKQSPAHRIADYYTGQPLNRDQVELRASGDTAAAILQESLPDPKIAQLSIASGEIPPSEGVIIDADGHVVSQAQGFKGDHYLPFDLKNLGRLRGGQYVRTRLSGGPTTEDIYTGLLTGARQIQVVSHSGVFTVEFDPDLRGGRRYSDKARKMVGRYESLLGVLAGGGQVREDLPPAEVARLKRQAYGDANWDPEVGEQNFQAELKRRRLEASVGVDEEDIEVEARHRVEQSPEWRTASPSQRGDLLRDAMGEVRDELGGAAYRMYRLDGPGYDGALKALKQEFPYFIRDVRWEPLPQFLMDRGLPRGDKPNFGPPDKGYVGPDQLTPFDRGGRGRLVPAGGAEGEGEAAAGARGAAGRPATGAAAPRREEAPAQRLSDIMSPSNAKFVRETAKMALGTFGSMGNVTLPEEIPHNWPIEDARGSGPMQYAKWLWRSNHVGEDPDKMVAWLLQHPEDQEKLKAAASEYGQYVHEVSLSGLNPDSVEQAAGELVEVIGMLSPFAKPAENPVLARPTTKDPKPQPFADILVLTTEKKIGDFLSMVGHQDKPLAAAIVDVEANRGSVVQDINHLLDAHEKDPENKATLQQLEALQKAWAFHQVVDVVDHLQHMGVVEAPKAQGASPSEPKEGTAKRLSRGSLQPLLPELSPVTKRQVEVFLSKYGRRSA